MDPVRQMYDHLQTVIDKQYAKPYIPPIRFRASEAGDCPRKIWYRLRGEQPKPISPFVKILTENGDVHHDLVRWRMREAGVELFDLDFDEDTGKVVETNHGVKTVIHKDTPIKISWRADGGVVIDGIKHVLEIKTLDGFSYSYMEKAYNTGDIVEYLRNHIKYRKFFLQAAVTAHLSGHTHIYLVIEDRGLGKTGFNEQNEELAYELKQEDVDEALDNFAFVLQQLELGEPPIHPYTKSSKPCQHCPFRAKCWGLDK